MEAIVRERRPLRALFKSLKETIEGNLNQPTVDKKLVNVNFGILADTFEKLARVDEKVVTFMRENPVKPEEEDREMLGQIDYKTQLELLRVKVEELNPPPSVTTEPVAESTSGAAEGKQSMQLPAVQIPKFGGADKDWMGFWAQFRKIHENKKLDESDKFVYLVQSLVPGTDPYKKIVSLHNSKENYEDAIKILQAKYGDEEKLRMSYVEAVLDILLTPSNEKPTQKDTFLALDSYRRALKTLKYREADPDIFAYPMFMACFNKTLLKEWKKDPLYRHDGKKDDPPRSKLDLFMDFVGVEMDIDDSVNDMEKFARKTIDRRRSSSDRRDSCSDRLESSSSWREGSTEWRPNATKKKVTQKPHVPTLLNFHAAHQEKAFCIFCRKNNHDSKVCKIAAKMTMPEKLLAARFARRCFQCLGTHFATNCRAKLKCKKCDGCHLEIMCGGKRPMEQPEAAEPPVKRVRFQEEGKSITHNMNSQVCSSEVILQTARVRLQCGEKWKEVRAFLDPGAHRSYILKSTVTELSLEAKSVERSAHSLFGGFVTKTVSHLIYDVDIRSTNGEFQMKTALRDQFKICNDITNGVKQRQLVMLELTKLGISLSDMDDEDPIEVLIGADYYGRLLEGQVEQLECGLTAIKTKLGWVLSGESNSSWNIHRNYLNMQVSDAVIAQLWSLETIGINDPIEAVTVAEREKAMKLDFFKKMTRLENGRYCVRLPWKTGHPPLHSNKVVAIKRLETTITKLKKQGLLEQYDKLLRDWMKEGFIELVPEKTTVGHYIPHRAVVKPESETTPVRPVFDASCKRGKMVSLNDCLEKGPNLLQLIPDVMLRFREKKVGFVSDVRKAFQMIEVAEEDRDAMRFFWCKDGKIEDLQEFRHVRVMFGATSSPFILAAVLEHHLSNLPENEKKIGKQLLESFYVDNCVSSVDTMAEYVDFREHATEVLKRIQMDLRMWFSSGEDFSDHQRLPVLGMLWDRKEDTLSLKLEEIVVPAVITKRIILSALQKIYDTIGFACPVLIPMKLLLQKAWLAKIKWDVEIPQEDSETFRRWCQELESLRRVRVPRVITGGERDRSKWSLHTFVDASALAYAAVVFLRAARDDGTYVQLVAAKARISPLKKTTIPRLELMACLIGARLAASVKRALTMEEVKTIYWSDSSTAVAWIQRMEPWGTFVGNRVKEIRLLTRPDMWRHVPGKLNPADLPSRGCTPKQLEESSWWNGPKFLLLDAEEWPGADELAESNEEEIFSERSSSKDTQPKVTQNFMILDGLRRQHSVYTQFRIMAWVKRFMHNATNNGERITGCLTREEILGGELQIWHGVQVEHFGEYYKNRLKGLEVFQDEQGIIRLKTRLTNLNDHHDFKFPIVLPPEAPIVKQLIFESHRNYCHAGVGFLLTKLREKYWILHGRKAIRGVTSKCYRCRIFAAKAFITPTAPLPLDRVKDAEPFQTTGVDLAGPLILRNKKKIWFIIFTCAVYRAVHLAVIENLSTTAFIKELKKFAEKYRRPEIIYCDNGTNFRGAENLFRKLDWDRIEKEEGVGPIRFKKIPPLSAWWGGWWERLIGTVKGLLKRTVGNESLNQRELSIILKDITDVMNQRPLTYVSEDPGDLEPLTPEHFIHPLGKVAFPENDYLEADKLRIRLKYLRTLRQELRNRFRREYLAQLISRNPKKAGRALKVGEMVLVGSDGKRRLEWPLGKVVEIFPGNDGICRVAKVRTTKGEFIRTVQRLYPLELDIDQPEVNEITEVASRTRSGRVTKPPVRYVSS